MAAAPFQTTLDAVVALVGGPSVLAQPMRTSMDSVRAAVGISVQAVRHLQQPMRLTNRGMSEVLAISESTLARREQAKKPLSLDEAKKTIRRSVAPPPFDMRLK